MRSPLYILRAGVGRYALVEVDSAVGKLAECSLLLDLGGLNGVLGGVSRGVWRGVLVRGEEDVRMCEGGG